MKLLKNAVMMGAVLTLSVSCFKKPVANRCKDAKFCVNSKMPLLNQGSRKLAPVIAKLKKDSSIKRDTGWCSAVASSMALAGEVRNAPTDVRPHPHIGTARRMKHQSNMDYRTRDYGGFIFNVGERIKTNWKRGGTYDNDRQRGTRYFYNGTYINSRRHLKGNVDARVSHRMKTQELINIFKKDMPALATSFYFYDRQRNGSYKIKGGHALTVNGYEDGKVKIFDPWGRVYNVKLGTSNSGGINRLPIVQHVSGDRGFVKAYTSSTRKIAFQRYNSFYTRMK